MLKQQIKHPKIHNQGYYYNITYIQPFISPSLNRLKSMEKEEINNNI